MPNKIITKSSENKMRQQREGESQRAVAPSVKISWSSSPWFYFPSTTLYCVFVCVFLYGDREGERQKQRDWYLRACSGELNKGSDDEKRCCVFWVKSGVDECGVVAWRGDPVGLQPWRRYLIPDVYYRSEPSVFY